MPPQTYPHSAHSHTTTVAHHISQSHTHTEHCTFTTHHTQSHSHTQPHYTADTHTNTGDVSSCTHRKQPFSQIQLLVLQHCLGNPFPSLAAHHIYCHYHHCNRSRNIPYGQDISESTQLCPQTKTSAWSCLLAPKAVQAHQVYAWF